MITELRSLLFVPGHKADWIQKALRSEADAIIIDLEDSVPEADKEAARNNARSALLSYAGRKDILVRPNGIATSHCGDDVLATSVEGLTAFLQPMIRSRDDVVALDSLIRYGEVRNDTQPGSVKIVASFEQAAAVENASQILDGPRIEGVMAAAAKNADIARSVGFSWTEEGSETLYLRSRIVLAARARGIRMIALGLWQDVRDLEGLRRFAVANSGLGYTGQVIIHPTHAAIANDEYGLSPDELEYYRRLVTAFEEGQSHGHGAVSFEGEHIDVAHAANAREILQRYAPVSTTES